MQTGRQQAKKNPANLLFIFKHIAVMPDARQGSGMVIDLVDVLDELRPLAVIRGG
jgi:RNA-splicing ligase RtcB